LNTSSISFDAVNSSAQRNLVTNGGWLDDVIWIVNTENPDDLSFLDEILSRSPLYKAHRLTKTVWWPDYSKLWRLVERGTIYVKIDDDIVSGSLSSMVNSSINGLSKIGLVCQ
jgi:hypothetical protein